MNLEKAIQTFRKILYRKPTATIKKKGSLVRVKNQAIEIARLLVRATGQNQLPIDLEPICEKMLIHTITESQSLSPFSAELIPNESGFTLRLEKSKNKARKRATIAHEIGHTLFYDTNRSPSSRILRYRAPTPREDKEEWIAWDFARELLLPRDMFLEELHSKMPSPSAPRIVELARKIEVSVDLFCRRAICGLNYWDPCATFTGETEAGRVRMSTIHVCRTKNFPPFYIKGKSGLLSLCPELRGMIRRVCSAELVSDSNFVEFGGFHLWIQVMRHFAHPQRILGILELPPS